MIDVARVSREMESHTAAQLLEWGVATWHPRIALAWSGAEDVVVVDLLLGVKPDARVFLIDTGRLNQETYDLVDRVRQRYGREIEVLFPDAAATQRMVGAKGMNLFYQSIENREACCGVRKVEPLRRILDGLDAWITGLRRDQASTRASVPKVAVDDDNERVVKLNPIADWSHDDVWRYILQRDLPYNKLHDIGYTSIGCAPCTRPVRAGEDSRAGRWWWEHPDGRECGLHARPRRGCP